MAATPISGPARVYRTASASRGIWLPLVLQMASTLAFWVLACWTASKVSAVSPDCEMAITSVWLSKTGSRYLNSLASSTSTGNRVQCSIAYLASSPEWNAVPQATMKTLSTSRSS